MGTLCRSTRQTPGGLGTDLDGEALNVIAGRSPKPLQPVEMGPCLCWPQSLISEHRPQAEGPYRTQLVQWHPGPMPGAP